MRLSASSSACAISPLYPIASARAGGVVSLLDVLPGETINATGLLQTSSIVRGMNVGSREMFEALNAFATTTKLKPLVSQIFRFEEAKQALATLAQGNTLGKIVIDVSGHDA